MKLVAFFRPDRLFSGARPVCPVCVDRFPVGRLAWLPAPRVVRWRGPPPPPGPAATVYLLVYSRPKTVKSAGTNRRDRLRCHGFGPFQQTGVDPKGLRDRGSPLRAWWLVSPANPPPSRIRQTVRTESAAPSAGSNVIGSRNSPVPRGELSAGAHGPPVNRLCLGNRQRAAGRSAPDPATDSIRGHKPPGAARAIPLSRAILGRACRDSAIICYLRTAGHLGRRRAY